jgi:hypothetical protein
MKPGLRETWKALGGLALTILMMYMAIAGVTFAVVEIVKAVL